MRCTPIRALANTMKTNGISLTFGGNCAEAFAHYSTVFKKKLTMSMTNGESPLKDQIPVALHGKIMHCSLDLENLRVMGTDHNPGMCLTELVVGTNAQITLTPSSKEETDRLFAELSEGGTVLLPLFEPSFWGSYFGALVDKFGIHWMFDFPITTSGDDATANN